MAEYTKEQLWELYEQLPPDLQKAVFSEDIGEKVRGFCYENNLFDEKPGTTILKNVGYVFLGLMDIEEFRNSFNELNIKKAASQNIYARINNEIFSELKESLEGLYGIKLKFEKTEKPETKKQKEEPKIKKQDRYLEPLE